MTIRRDEGEARVLKTLQENLPRSDLFEAFCDEFTRRKIRSTMKRTERSEVA